MKTDGNNSGLDYHNPQRKRRAKEDKTQDEVNSESEDYKAAVGSQYANAVIKDKVQETFHNVARFHFQAVITQRPLEAIKVCTLLYSFGNLGSSRKVMYYPQPLTISNLQLFNSIDARIVLRYDHTGASDPIIFKHSYGNTCDPAVSGNSNVDTRDPADSTKWHYATDNLDRGPRHRRNAKPDQLNDVDTDQYCLATDQCDPVGLYSPDRSLATRCYRCAHSGVAFVTACTAGWCDPTMLPANSTALGNAAADRKTATAHSGKSQVPSGRERPGNPCCTRQSHNG
ncbi:hypothetical protein F4824DRAFT_498778 [Ustulina deusta]|nr:hypothetical protein F4824DRAFT_498778 [Ustulina deusta]